ncbi:MMPL family transporter [Streptomyces sp. NPDC003032]
MAAVGVGGLDRLTNSGLVPTGSASERDNRILASRHHAGGTADLVLLVRTDASGGLGSGPVAEQSRVLERRVTRFPGVVSTTSYWNTGDASLRSRDGSAALMTVDLGEDEAQACRTAETLVPQVTGRSGPLTVSATGPAWVSTEVMRQSRGDLLRAELFAVPLAAAILLFVFRSLAAAVIPVLTGAVAVAGTLAVLRLLTSVTEVSVYAANITTALGFGLAVDYALFAVARFREEQATGLATPQAIVHGTAAAGRTVLASAGVVALSLCSLFLFPFGFLHSIAWAGISVVVLSAASTVLVVPALLTVLAPYLDRFDLFTHLRLRGAAGPAGEGMLWRRVARTVCRRPLAWAVGAVALLGVCVVPFAHASFALSDARTLPAHSEPHAVARAIAQDFPHPPDRRLTVGLPRDTGAHDLDVYARRAAALPGVAEVRTATGSYRQGEHGPLPERQARRHLAPGGPLLTVFSSTGPATPVSRQLVRELRDLPAAGRSPVAGEAARAADTRAALIQALPGACTLVASVTFVLLALFTRSLLIPVKAVVVAAISLAACMGCLVFVFQDGHLRALVGGFTVTGDLDGTIVVFVLVIAYALSVDYEMFLLSRICEAYAELGDTERAVTTGVQRTGRLVTAAALTFAAAVGALATSGLTPLKVIGIGLALATVVDATLVRGILVPAVMTLTGRANWWLPRLPSGLSARVRPHRK